MALVYRAHRYDDTDIINSLESISVKVNLM